MSASRRPKRRWTVVIEAIGLFAAVAFIATASPGAQAGTNHRRFTTRSTTHRSLLENQESMMTTTLDALANGRQAYNGAGEWDTYHYTTDGEWQKEQFPASDEAALAVANNDKARAKIAIDTVNTAIAQHQDESSTSNAGDFALASDKAAAVDSSFWVEQMGLIANTLSGAGMLDPTTRQAWEQSMVKYDEWLTSSGNWKWYINGNDNLRFAAIFLETAKLATAAGDSQDAANANAEYQQEQQFVDDPGWTPSNQPGPGYGWNTSGNTGWFAEFPPGTGTGNVWCNNQVPPAVLGQDYNYTAAQLATALDGYILSGYDGWWQNVVTREYNLVEPRVSNGQIDADGGCRGNYGTYAFYPEVYAVLDQHNLGAHDTEWSNQTNALQSEFSNINDGTVGHPDWIPTNEYGSLGLLAPAYMDAGITGGDHGQAKRRAGPVEYLRRSRFRADRHHRGSRSSRRGPNRRRFAERIRAFEAGRSPLPGSEA
jgi:hypothetical protein